MFENCYLYNPQTDNVVKLAKTLQAIAERRYFHYYFVSRPDHEHFCLCTFQQNIRFLVDF